MYLSSDNKRKKSLNLEKIQLNNYHHNAIRSRNSQNGLANMICFGLLHSGENIAGLATMMNIALALDTATFKRFGLYRKSIPLGASSGVEVAIE